MTTELKSRHCVPCEGGSDPLAADAIQSRLKEVDQRWALNAEQTAISATIEFANYYQTTAFVNAVAYIAHHEDHHPDITFSYRFCDITWTTHAVKGLSDNDFICAAKIDALLD